MAELTDEEITQRVIKSINDLKFAKSTIKKIYDKTDLCSNASYSVKFTVINKQRLEELQHIEKVLYEIQKIAKSAYLYLKGNDNVRQDKGNCNKD